VGARAGAGESRAEAEVSVGGRRLGRGGEPAAAAELEAGRRRL
jgi:hypothetical protein